MKETWKQVTIGLLKGKYQKKVEEWQNLEYVDDRAVFCGIYRKILKAVETLPEEPHNYVCCAMNDKIRSDREKMDEIMERFRGR